ncbi:GNAT family N-acetyltransferase [Flavobacterium sp. AED]|uniref:GNAT family N-acetyltransferase n=1 Tax=Flavobacterium sp. AED TaxID=1423323 RepID=UPI00057F2087|nr:GNAT family N-acetyltransferase [Flavobacterium sp. AED]KIA85345.1 GNAT family acetyltransferase [Flavobacterium sp. AED]MDI1306886.1 GNAT family N-acetyltransferase [bacterium]
MNNKIEVIKTTSENLDFGTLIAALDASLWERYPELKTNYWGNNVIELNPNVVIIYLDDKAVACGCFKKYDKNTIELKRMFVSPEARGMGFAQKILQELELWAHELGFSFSVLETLYKQKEAIGLYQKVGYTIVDNYEPYVGLENSICMKKQI